MTREDLLALLDMKATTPVKEESKLSVEELSVPSKKVSKDAKLSDTAIVLDQWDRRRGEKLFRDKSAYWSSRNIDALALADFHAAVYLTKPETEELCSDAKRLLYIEEMMNSPEFLQLRSSTVWQEAQSELAAVKLASSYAVYCEKTKEQKEENWIQTNIQVSKDLEEAQEEVEGMEDIIVGCGIEKGVDGKLDAKKVGETFHKIRGNYFLRKVFNCAGKMIRYAQGSQRTNTFHGSDDVIGVEMGGDLSKLVPHELAMLVDEDLEMDACRRLLENQCMQLQKKSPQRVGKGPVVVCVDESGSMTEYDRIIQAKAFALAMAWVARHQKRWCALVGFSAGPDGNVCVIPPGKTDEKSLLDWISHFYQGGTSMDCPMDTLPNTYWKSIGCKPGKTDMIIITDGIVNVDYQLRERFTAWKAQQQCKLTTLILARGYGDMEKVSDSCHLINGIHLNEGAITKCLSI